MGKLSYRNIITAVIWFFVFPSVIVFGTTMFAFTALTQYLKQVAPLPMQIWDGIDERIFKGE